MNVAPVRPRTLHIAHSWGGGVARWIEDFVEADRASSHLVLQSVGSEDCYGVELRLLDPRARLVLETWVLRDPISEIRSSHDEYRRILEQVCEDYGVSRVYASTLVGHSLDVLSLPLPCTLVYHDYFVYCPAFSITRDGVCTTCSRADLEACRTWDSSHRPRNPAAYYLRLREDFFELVARSEVTHVCPSHSVYENLETLDSRFSDLHFHVIEHGSPYEKKDLFGGAESGRRLRVGVLGKLGWNKGNRAFARLWDRIRLVADVWFVGGQENAAGFRRRWGASVVGSYDRAELPSILEQSRLDLALSLPQVPETFSYTLSESWCFCIPPATHALGAHAERITDGVDGFLVGRDDEAILDFLLRVDRERNLLRDMAAKLRSKPVRTVTQQVREYHRLYPDSTVSGADLEPAGAGGRESS